MEELLNAILMASLTESEKAKIEQPVFVSVKKDPGLNGKVTTEIYGPSTSVITCCVILLFKVVKSISPECKAIQKEILETIYTMAADNL
jgi:hypothetical protein